jgi:hypothetical protein
MRTVAVGDAVTSSRSCRRTGTRRRGRRRRAKEMNRRAPGAGIGGIMGMGTGT